MPNRPSLYYSKLAKALVIFVLAITGGAVGGKLSHSTSNDYAKEPIVPMADERTQTPSTSGSIAVTGELTTTAISPTRIVDTRIGSFSFGGDKKPWGPGETRTVQTAGLGSIPPDVVGVVLNVTALNSTSPDTFITVFPSDTSRPEASTLNPTPNEIAFNAATTLLTNGTFDVYNYSGSVDLIIDVTAYMTNALSADVSRLQTGERLFPLKGIAGVTFGLSGDIFTDWKNYATADPDGFFGAPVEPGRFSDNAEVVAEVAIVPITTDIEVCFRIHSTSDGPIEESQVCANRSTPVSAAGVVFLTTPRVPLPSGKLTVHAKVIKGPTIAQCTYMNCSASMTYLGFRTFDS